MTHTARKKEVKKINSWQMREKEDVDRDDEDDRRYHEHREEKA